MYFPHLLTHIQCSWRSKIKSNLPNFSTIPTFTDWHLEGWFVVRTTCGIFQHCCVFPHPRYSPNCEAGRRALTPLAGGFRGILWGIMGDLDYFTKALLLPRSTLGKRALPALQMSRQGQVYMVRLPALGPLATNSVGGCCMKILG